MHLMKTWGFFFLLNVHFLNILIVFFIVYYYELISMSVQHFRVFSLRIHNIRVIKMVCNTCIFNVIHNGVFDI